MLSLAVVAALLAVSPPVLPEEAAASSGESSALEPASEAPGEAIVIEADPAASTSADPAASASADPAASTSADPAALPSAGPAALPSAGPAAPQPVAPVVIVDHQVGLPPAPPPMPTYRVPAPPWSGSGRFVGGSIMLVTGVGLLSAAALEFSHGRDTTRPFISHVPAGVSMLAAGGLMIGLATRDQRRLSEWEAATQIDARPSGNGLIVGGVTAISLGAMAGIATAVATDLRLDAPLSIRAGWATAGIGLGGGAAMLVTGIVRRQRYAHWRKSLRGMPMVAPARAGATVGFVGQF